MAALTTNDVFDRLGGPAEVGRRIGVTTEHAAAMKRRGRIPDRYWLALMADGSAAAVGITLEVLALIAEGANRDLPTPSQAEAADVA